MQNRKVYGVAALTLALGMASGGLAGVAQAQPDPNNAPKADNPAARPRAKGAARKAGKGQRAGLQQKLMEKQMEQVAAVAGKPLTDEQKQQVREAITARAAAMRAAQEKYWSEVAKIVGVPVEELMARQRQDRKNNPRKGNKENAAPAAG